MLLQGLITEQWRLRWSCAGQWRVDPSAIRRAISGLLRCSLLRRLPDARGHITWCSRAEDEINGPCKRWQDESDMSQPSLIPPEVTLEDI